MTKTSSNCRNLLQQQSKINILLSSMCYIKFSPCILGEKISFSFAYIPSWQPQFCLQPCITGVFHLVWKKKVKISQSCLTLCDPIDSSPPSSSVHGILQARTLELVAISFSNACVHVNLLQSCLTLSLYGQQPNRLLCPWDSPSKNTGVSCHSLLQGNLPRPRIELMSPALAGRFFSVRHQGSPSNLELMFN